MLDPRVLQFRILFGDPVRFVFKFFLLYEMNYKCVIALLFPLPQLFPPPFCPFTQFYIPTPLSKHKSFSEVRKVRKASLIPNILRT
jgi:hypothetical protein